MGTIVRYYPNPPSTYPVHHVGDMYLLWSNGDGDPPLVPSWSSLQETLHHPSPLPGINLGPTTSVHPMYCACTNGEQLLQVYYDNVCIMPFNVLRTPKNFRTDSDNLAW